MAIFDTQPVIIEFFPLLVMIPAVVTFVLMLVMGSWSQRSENPTLPFKEIHARRALQLLVGVPFAAMIVSVIVALTFHTDAPYPLFILSQVILDAVICGLIGVLVGFILVALYLGLGVSAFLLCASLMCTVPLAAVSAGSAGFIISMALDMVDSLVVFALFFNSCLGCLMQGTTPKVRPTDRSVSQVLSHTAGTYVLESVRVLRERTAHDDDTVAPKALEEFLQTTGRVGDFIRETVQRGTPLLQTASGPRGPIVPKDITRLMPRGNWTLTNPRFRHRVKTNRVLFVVLILTMASLVLNFHSDLSTPLNQWGAILILPLLIFSLPLAFIDPLFVGKRLDVRRTVNVALAPLRGTESKLLVGAETSAPAAPHAVDEISPAVQKEPTNIMLSSDFIEHQEPSLQSFLRAVMAGKDNVYEESKRPLYITAVGGFTGFLGVLLAIPTFLSYNPIFLGAIVVLICAGLPVMIIGGGWWYSLTKRTYFRGCRRSWLSVALSYLDAKEAGVVDLGMFMSVPRPPRQFVFLPFAGASTLRHLFRKLHPEAGQVSYPSLEREAAVVEIAPIRALALLMPLILVMMVAMTFTLPQMFPFVLLIAALSVGMLLSYLSIRRKLKRAESESTVQVSSEPPETVVGVLRMLRDEYSYPLRLLTVKTHDELVYTGRIFLTSTEVRFREAVFIPSTSNGRSK